MSPVKSPKEVRARDIGKKDKIVVEKPEEVELPQGWKKEVKVRKSGSITKLDRSYTDPVTGYIFRSLRDVQRYIKTGRLGRLAVKPKDNEGVDTNNTTGKKIVKLEETEEKSETGKSESPHRASKRLAGIDIDTPPPPSPETKIRQGKRVAAPEYVASPPELKTRRITRQSGVKIKSPPPSPPDTRANRQAARRSKVAEIINSATPKQNADVDNKQEISILSPPVNQENFKKDELEIKNQVTHTTATHQPPTTISPPPGFEKQSRPESSINFSLNDFWTDPCIEFAVKTLTGGAIPFGDLSTFTSQSLNPHTESLWTDPCIEFAVRTLTGVAKDDYLSQQTGTENHFETGHNGNFNNTQPESGVLAVGNSGLQLQKAGVNRGCSRSRLFQ